MILHRESSGGRHELNDLMERTGHNTDTVILFAS